MNIYAIGFGAVGGVGWSIMRYYREHQKDPKLAFDIKKFVKTLGEGVIVGLIAGYSGIEFDAVTSMGIYGTLTGGLDTLINIIWSWIQKR
jgi:hypothetical protein